MLYDVNNREIKSEGKIIEITPVIELNHDAFMLPVMTYHVENWLLGMLPNVWYGRPQIIGMEYARVILANGPKLVTLSFIVRVLEDSPSITVGTQTVDLDAAMVIADALMARRNNG